MFALHRIPSKSQLRWFGLSIFVVLCVFAFIAWWRFSAEFISVLLLSVGMAIAVTYYVLPQSQGAIIRGFRLLTLPLQIIVSFLLLAVLYYLIITPIGLMLRLCGRDPLAKRLNSEAPTHWEDCVTSAETGSYFRQY